MPIFKKWWMKPNSVFLDGNTLRIFYTVSLYDSSIDALVDHIEVLSSPNTVHVLLLSAVVRFWSFNSSGWLNVKWPTSIWSLWVIHNKQMILKPSLHSLRGRPVIGCNPVLLSSPDGRKWERRVSVDNGYTEMLYKSLPLSFSLSCLHACKHISRHKVHSASLSLEHDGLLWQAVHCVTSWPFFKTTWPLIPLSYPCFSSPDLHAGQVCSFEPPLVVVFSWHELGFQPPCVLKCRKKELKPFLSLA